MDEHLPYYARSLPAFWSFLARFRLKKTHRQRCLRNCSAQSPSQAGTLVSASNILVKIGEAPEGALVFLRWLLRPVRAGKSRVARELLGQFGWKRRPCVSCNPHWAFRGKQPRHAQELRGKSIYSCRCRTRPNHLRGAKDVPQVSSWLGAQSDWD